MAASEVVVADPFGKPWPGIGIAGSAALSFANTLDWRLRETPVELLLTPADLLRWGWSTKALSPAEARTLRSWCDSNPRVAARALAAAVLVREAIAAVFQALARGERVPAEPLARLDAACREARTNQTLRLEGGKVALGWRDVPPSIDWTVWAAALDAARILLSAERDRVRQCGDAQCGWLFLDTSRNGSRRWCTMKACGNRNKARSFYSRSRTGRPRKN